MFTLFSPPLLNHISPVAVYTGIVRRMMSTVAMLGQRSSLVHLISVSCGSFGFSCSPRQAPNSLSTVRSRYRRPLYQSEVRRWGKRCILLCMKDSHCLLKVYFDLLPNEGNYLVLLLTDAKQLLGFRLGHILSLWKLRTYKCQNQGKNAGWMLRLT